MPITREEVLEGIRDLSLHDPESIKIDLLDIDDEAIDQLLDIAMSTIRTSGLGKMILNQDSDVFEVTAGLAGLLIIGFSLGYRVAEKKHESPF